MELRVETTKGKHLPNDCYVGIKIGDILKQGRYEANRCYHFPQVEKRRNAKIDIYQHVGSCTVAVDPDANFLQEVNVQSLHASFPGTTLKVSVQHATNKLRDEQTKVLKKHAKDYLSKFSIEERLTSAVKAVLQAQAEDPIEYLCKYLGGTLPGKSDKAKPTASANAETQTDPTASACLKTQMEAATSAHTGTLMEPATSTRTDTQTEPATSAHAEWMPTSPRKNDDQGQSSANIADATKCHSTRSSMKDGSQPDALNEGKQKVPDQLEAKQKVPDHIGRSGALPAEQPSIAADAAAVRAKAAGLLQSGAQDGSLRKALHEVKAKQAKQKALPAEQPSIAADAAAVRAKAAALLQSGAQDGSLRKALHEVKAKQDSVKPDHVAKQTSLPAVQTSQTIEAETVRAKAAGLLRSGALDGSLKKALHEVKAATVPAQPNHFGAEEHL
eukprot:TRINITY_DN4827_c0_g1_i1.p1 TRINITY_DN4827_c0_g1~~TRINITY_DN4827_c0_g1_i1.p1  ORF type:complete len:463 (-),score=111.66 TRINITY_DN4827_c0_g1_i1:23-1354(-)